MRQSIITFLFVMAAVMTPRPSSGLNVTPDSDRAVVLEFAAYQIGDDGAMVKFVAPSCGYSLDVAANLFLNNSPQLRITHFGNMLRDGYGWWFMSGHGDVALQVEPYATSSARDQSLAAYLTAGYGTDELVASFDGLAYGIAVTNMFMMIRYDGGASLVHVSTCNSLDFYNGFPGRATFIGYDYACRSDTSAIDIRDLYSRMAGWQGVANRTIGQAYLVTTLATPLGNQNMVLAPIVSSTNMMSGSKIDRMTSKYVEFDCAMFDGTPAANLMSGGGELDVSNVTWSGNHRINFRVSGYNLGPGSIRVVTDTSFTINGGAVSYPGYIHLIGNLNGGFPPKNGYAPCGDFMINMESGMGGDNPKANIPGFSVTTVGAGVAVEVVVEAEYQTNRYLIEQADNPAGPFVTLAEIQASGPQVHRLTIPGAPMDGVYRLMEVETSGRQLQHGLTEVTAPLTAMNDEMPEISPETENILEFYRQQFLSIDQNRTNSPQTIENFEYNIFTRNVFLSRAQSYLGFLSTKGVQVGVIYTLENIGGAVAIKTLIDGLRFQNGKYFLRYGDSNDDSDFDGVHWWSDDTRWKNGFIRGAFPSQTAYNFMPGKYFAVTDSQQTAMTGTTPYFPSDSWFIDFDNDSLPDPGLAFGNAPVRSDAEAANWNLKQMNAWNMSPATSYMNHVGVWVFGQDYIGNSGAEAIAKTRSILANVPATMVIDSIYDANPTAPMLPSQRNTAATNAYAQGRSLIFAFGTISSGRGTHLAAFWDKYYGFNPSALASNPTRLPFMLVPSCGAMNTDETENPATGFGRPLMDMFSVLPNQGPWGGFGPTRGSWQKGNGEVGDEVLKRLFKTGSRSAAMACFEGLYLAAQRDPYNKQLFMSYRFVGCPAVRLVNMRYSIVDVDDNPLPRTVELSRPFPNPSSDVATIQFSLPMPGQVKLRVYDLSGRLVRTLVNAPYPAGHFTVSWDGQSDDGQLTATGTYFVRLEAGSQQVTQKVIRRR